MAAHEKYVRAFDGAMPATALAHLRRTFGAESGFWNQHGYHEPGCGFFSYAHALPPWNAEDVGNTHPLRSTMDAVVRRVWRVACAAFRLEKDETRARRRRREVASRRRPRCGLAVSPRDHPNVHALEAMKPLVYPSHSSLSFASVASVMFCSFLIVSSSEGDTSLSRPSSKAPMSGMFTLSRYPLVAA